MSFEIKPTPDIASDIIAQIAGTAPETLDTINELAAALNNNPLMIGDLLGQISDLSLEVDNKADSASVSETYLSISDANNTFLSSSSAANTYAAISSLNQKKTEIIVDLSANLTMPPMQSGRRYLVDTSSARQVALPSMDYGYPVANGDEIQIFDVTGSAATNNITVLNRGHKINGEVQDLIIDVNNAAVVLLYTGSTYGWRVS